MAFYPAFLPRFCRSSVTYVLNVRQGALVIVLLRQEKAVEIVEIIHRRKVRLPTGKV
jgi:hypothetical protein